jgi:hypothetical protein
MNTKTVLIPRMRWQFEASIPSGVGRVIQMMEYNGGVYMLTDEHFILSYEKIEGTGRVRVLDLS